MPVKLHTPDTIYSARHLPSWFLLTAAAGAVNGFAFLECQQFVSHVTGTATRAGLEWPHVGLAAEYAVVFLGFVAGAVTAVVTIEARARRREPTRWATPLVAVAAILVAVAAAGRDGAFGPFGTIHADEPPPVTLLTLLAFAMGLQNAAVASTTGLAIRTTHLTGPTTDLGIGLGAAIMAAGPADRRAALRGAGLRAGKIASFASGAGLMLPLAGAYGYTALLVPAGFILAAAGLSFIPAWSPSDYPLPVAAAPVDDPAVTVPP